jgi:hypothetical protein
MVLAVLAAGALLYLFQLGSEGRANLYRRVGDTIRGRHTPVEEEPVVPELNQETDAATVCMMEKGAVAPIYCMRIQTELTNPFPLPLSCLRDRHTGPMPTVQPSPPTPQQHMWQRRVLRSSTGVTVIWQCAEMAGELGRGGRGSCACVHGSRVLMADCKQLAGRTGVRVRPGCSIADDH